MYPWNLYIYSCRDYDGSVLLCVQYLYHNHGIICLETTVYMRRLFHVSSVGYVILSALVVLGGIIMMFFSPDTVKAAAIMTGIIFITNAVINSVILYRIQKISKECAGQIQEAVDALNGNIIDVDDDVK